MNIREDFRILGKVITDAFIVYGNVSESLKEYKKGRKLNFTKKYKEHNDLPCTTIDSLLPYHDLSTMIKQVTTYNDGSFDHTEYLSSPMQPFGCIEPVQYPV